MDLSCRCGYLSNSKWIIPLKHVCITGELANAVSHMSMQFVYENDCELPMEAVFTFPLHEVAVYYCDAVIGDRKIVSECRPKVGAMATYSEALKSGHTAFVIQQSDHCEDIFQMIIGHIPSKGKVLINLKYVGLMDARNLYSSDGDFTHSEIRFILPQVLHIRYSPAGNKIADISQLRSIGRSFDPCDYTLEFNVSADMPYDIISVDSEHDQFDVNYSCSSKRSASIKLVSTFKRNHDLQLVIKFEQKLNSMAVVAPGDVNKGDALSKHCLTVQFLPEIGKDHAIMEQGSEIILVVDRSETMYSDKFYYARCMLRLLLEGLPVGCWFQVVGFGSTQEYLFAEPQVYSQATLAQALEYQRQMDANMHGKNLFAALSTILDKSSTRDGRHRQVIVLTDGVVFNADEVVALIHLNNSNAQIFAIGLGEGASTTLVSAMARVGRGLCAFARNASEIDSAATKILHGILQKPADNVQVNWELVNKSLQPAGVKPLELLTIPQNMPHVYNGQYLTCHAFFTCENPADLSGNLTLQFEIMGKQHKVVFDAESITVAKEFSSAVSQAMQRLAGKFQIEELVREYHALLLKQFDDHNNDHTPHVERIRDQIESLAITLNLLTKLTTLVGVGTSVSTDGGSGKLIVAYMGHTEVDSDSV